MSAVVPGLPLFKRAAAELGGLFAWWVQELREARIALLERLAPQRSQRFIVDLGDGRGLLTKAGEPSAQPLPFSVEQAHLPPLQEISAVAMPVKARAEIVLPAASVLTFELRLPPLGEREVAGAVALLLERELPLPAEKLFVDWHVADKAPDRSRLVAVAVARQAEVLHWQEEVRAWGWRVARIGCRDGEGQFRFNLLPPPVQRLSFAVGKREVILACSALVLCAAYSLTVAGQWLYERTALRERVSEARAQIARVDELQAQLVQESRPISSLQALMQMPAAGRALASLSSSVPRDSWLYQADIRALTATTTIGFEGYGPSAATLVASLEQSQHFDKVELLEVASVDLDIRLDRVKIKASMQSNGAQ